uniref:DNA topoisomerase I DNA binding eukaryotic-type domain-containing protein n=1 Tax=Cyprinus carpio carpio TaxID=630221 RepID=A0A8C1AL10_CYPCA
SRVLILLSTFEGCLHASSCLFGRETPFSPEVLWEEEKYEHGIKWKFLEHKEPYFPPDLAAEEVALFFAQMLDHEYTTKVVFRNNFFRDWTKINLEEKQLIMDLNKCDFGELHAKHKQKVEVRKNLSKEEKLLGVLHKI